jgi:hypothetical protein
LLAYSGKRYDEGISVMELPMRTLKRLLLAASMCCLVATANAAPMDDAGAAYDAYDDAKAIRILRPLAERGDVAAQYNLGVMYYRGRGVVQNDQEAVRLWKLAASQGNASAQYNLGWLYYGGKVDKDDKEVLKWYRLSSGRGYAYPRDIIGWVYKSPAMDAAAQEATPNRRSTSIKTNREINQSNQTEAPKKVSQHSSISHWQPVDDHQSLTKQSQPHQRASPPKLVFVASAPKSDGTVELSGRVIGDASIYDISINGRTLEAPLTKDGSFKVIRGLQIGVVTTYRLSVMDEYGQRVETEINVERAAVQYAEQVAPLNPRKLKAQTNPNAVALIIGVESYLSLPQAQYADSDATHFYDYANQSLGVPPHKIKLLTDSKASRLELLKAMRSWMKAEVNGKSDVYIFFAGHGLASADGSKTYLLPADGDRDLLDETSILRDDLIASAKGAKTITMFLDTCYSGGTRTNEILLADARPIAIVPDKSALPSNVTVLAAASGAQLSSTYEAAQQGLFSYWLMKGLEGDADANKDKKITTGELHEYVARQVGPMAQRRNRQQDPQLMGDSTRVLVSY